jgi:hypothetical protein
MGSVSTWTRPTADREDQMVKIIVDPAMRVDLGVRESLSPTCSQLDGDGELVPFAGKQVDDVGPREMCEAVLGGPPEALPWDER